MRSASNRELRTELEAIAEAHEGLLFGRCVVFAVTMHRLSSLPLYGLVGYDEEIGREVLIHAYVKLDEDTVVDIRGPRTFQEMFQDFETDPASVEADEMRFTIRELAKLGLNRSSCPTPHEIVPIAKQIWKITRELRARGQV
jgi:hypothetical protein